MVGRIGVGTAVGPVLTEPLGEDSVQLITDEDTVAYQIPTLGRHTLGVVTDCGQAIVDGAIGGDVHHRRSVPHGVEFVRGRKRGAGIGGLIPDRPVVLGGMTDGLMDGQPQVRGVDHQIGRARGDTGRFGFLGQQGGQFGQFAGPVPHLVVGQGLPAAAGGRGKGAHGLEAARRGIHRHRLQDRHRADSLLGDRRAEGVGVEGLFLD